MNVRAKCVKRGCEEFGIEKSVAVGQLNGYGAKNDRVKCPACGELMQTTQTEASDPKRLASGRAKISQRPVKRAVRPTAKRKKVKREYKRTTSRRSSGR